MAPLLQKMNHHQTILSATRFALVGALGTLIDFTLFFAAQLVFNLPFLAANTISYSAGIVNNYYFHRTWTFTYRPQKAVSKQFALFVMISLTALMINSMMVYLLTPVLTVLLLEPALAAPLAKICATVTGLGWNFFANHFWTFRH